MHRRGYRVWNECGGRRVEEYIQPDIFCSSKSNDGGWKISVIKGDGW